MILHIDPFIARSDVTKVTFVCLHGRESLEFYMHVENIVSRGSAGEVLVKPID